MTPTEKRILAAARRKDLPEYGVWMNMNNRCHNKNNNSYKNYGGRGIFVCSSWRKSFEQFYADMGERPQGKTLERIDNDRGYEPHNCKWATLKEQRANCRQPLVMIEAFGKTLCIEDWSKERGIRRTTIRRRLDLGLTGESVLTKEKYAMRGRIIAFRGRSMRLPMWAKELGICDSSLRERIAKWPLDVALTHEPTQGIPPNADAAARKRRKK